MTTLQAAAEIKYGSLRKLAKAINKEPGSIHQVNSGHRRAWPKLRRELSEALEMPEAELFDEGGWLKQAS